MAHFPHSSHLAAGTTITPYPPEEFADLLTHDPERAFALLGAMTPAQCEAQAEAYVAWLGRFGLYASLELVCEAWGVMSKTDHSHKE